MSAVRRRCRALALSVMVGCCAAGCGGGPIPGSPSSAAPASASPSAAPLSGPTGESAAVVRVNAVVDRIHALVGDRSPGKVSYVLEADKNRVVIYWKAGVPRPFETLLPELRRTVDVVLRDAPYSRLELDRELDRLLGVAVANESSSAVPGAPLRTDGPGIVLLVEKSYEATYPTLRSLGLSSSYPVVLEHTDSYPVPG